MSQLLYSPHSRPRQSLAQWRPHLCWHGQCRVLPQGCGSTPCCSVGCAAKGGSTARGLGSRPGHHWPWPANNPPQAVKKMHRWEYIDLAELLPQTSAHDATTPEVDPHHFVLFPGCEFIKPKKHGSNLSANGKWPLQSTRQQWGICSWKQSRRCSPTC